MIGGSCGLAARGVRLGPTNCRPFVTIVETFEDLPLHDAALLGLRGVWTASEVVMDLVPAQVGEWWGQRIRLVWSGLERLHVPHELPWGRSDAVNAHGREGQRFWFEMQSGDLLEVWASRLRIDRLAK